MRVAVLLCSQQLAGQNLSRVSQLSVCYLLGLIVSLRGCARVGRLNPMVLAEEQFGSAGLNKTVIAQLFNTLTDARRTGSRNASVLAVQR